MPDHKVILDFFGPWGWKAAHLARQILWRIIRPRRLAAAAVVFNQEGQVLLIENSYAKGWRLPGGGVERGEAVEQSMIREMIEETGLTPLEYELCEIVLQQWMGADIYVVLYKVTRFDGQARADGNEILQVLWADPHNLPNGVEKGTARRIKELVAGEAPSQLW